MILVEYNDPIYTLGRSSLSSDVLDSSIVVNKVERGGEVTYHGPGQLVGYLIFDLEKQPPFKKDLHLFTCLIEKSIIHTLKEKWNLEAIRVKGKTGVW